MQFKLAFRNGGEAVVDALYVKVEGDEQPSYVFYSSVEDIAGSHGIAAFPVELVTYIVPSDQAELITDAPKTRWGPA